MKKELTNMIINYTDKDLNYIEEIAKFVESKSKEIIAFFDIKRIEPKIKIYLYDSLTKFREKYIELGLNLTDKSIVPLWVCGFTFNDTEIYTLCLEEYRKTRSHEKDNIGDLEHLILHEFVHSCYWYYIKNQSNYKYMAWLSEGIATTISHQYDDEKLSFNASLEEMQNGCQNYSNYYAMFTYVFKKYGKVYILDLINDSAKAVQMTPILYKETKEYYSKKLD
jgi:hypothetical protein